MVDTHTHIKAEITRRLDDLSTEDLGRVLRYLDAPADMPPGLTGAEWLKFAGTMTNEEAEEMTRIIEEGCEQIDPNGW